MVKLSKVLLVSMLAGSCIMLCSCESKLDNTPTILDNEANYSVDIALPYATASTEQNTSGEAEQEALEINEEGKVTVNDSKVVLRESDTEGTSSSNYKSLRQGSTGLAVQVLQTRLAELGYYTGSVSSVFDQETENAVRKFEQTYGTMQTGVATADLQERLYSDNAVAYGTDAYNSAVISQYRVLQPGDSGSSVYALQQRLKTLGYPITSLTGTFDDQTAEAVGLFYEAYNLKRSDIANVALQQELYSDSAKNYTGSTEQTEETTTDDTSNFVAVTLNNTLELQQRLIGLGYMRGSASGSVDDATTTAVKLLQQACGVEPTGEVSEEVIDLLNSESVPSFTDAYGQYENLLEGSNGESVEALQQRLIDLGFVTGTPNGDYGSATTDAVTLFQNANNLEETGVATAQDQAVLFSSFVLNMDGEQIFKDQASTTADIADTTGTQQQSIVQAVKVSRMTEGSTGDDVLQLQYRLTELGYVSSITATFDSITAKAVQTFQGNVGVEQTGIAGPTLLTFIYSDAAPNSATCYFTETQSYRTLEPNDTGEEVENLQKQLWKLGYLSQNGTTAGTYDAATQQAVSDVQTALNYEEPDGIAGAELQCYLFSDQVSIGK